MPVARVQRPTEPAGETAQASPFGIKLYNFLPLPYKKANDYRSVNLREGAGGGFLITSPPADETRAWAAPSLEKVRGEARGWAYIKPAAQLRGRAGRRPIALRARAAATPGSLLSRLRRSLRP